MKKLIVIFVFGLIPAGLCQFYKPKPISRHITITSFRYGKSPSVIRCNRGDTLHLAFKTKDTGHSFFLEEFDIDAKVSPSREDVSVFKTSDPTTSAVDTSEVTIIATHAGLKKYLVSRSNYRCHVWCGPMHAFEQGKLVIMPNTILIFGMGCMVGILITWFFSIFKMNKLKIVTGHNSYTDLLSGSGLLRNLTVSRWPQLLMMLVAMLIIYIVILTAVLGTKMSGRNLGVLLMWAVWLFFLVALITPILGRFWCTICPLPFFGDWFQRRSFFAPEEGSPANKSRLHGISLKWPVWLSNDWPKLFIFMIFATFSTTLVAVPSVSGITVLMLLLIPTLMALVWEKRAFCRYLCPVSVFVGPFSRMSTLALRAKNQQICSRCKNKYCAHGSDKAWACPYGIDPSILENNSDCGLCLECIRSCRYDNITIFRRPFASETGTVNNAQAWQTIAIFTLALVYGVLYEGHWPLVRDFVNILDMDNWGLFGIYAAVVWFIALLLMPAVIYLLSFAGVRWSGIMQKPAKIFLGFSGSLLPLGLTLWIAFVIPMLFVNITFILQSLSDPFGWGWDFFGTANIPWHQFIPQYISWIQAVIILTGVHLSLRNLRRSFESKNLQASEEMKLLLPMGLFLVGIALAGVVFYTN